MVFGGVLAATAPLAGAISGESNVTQSWTWAANEDSLDTQDLLVENLRLRRQMATSKEKERKTQEENEHLRRQIVLLQQQQQMMVRSHSRFETELEKAGIMLAQEARVEGDEDLRGLKEGEEGFMDAKVAVLSKRLSAVAKRSCWLQVQVEQARDQAADANRRQVDAERIVSELMKENGPGVSIEYLRAIATEPCTSNVHLPVGSDIWKDDKAFAEGLPKTIPFRAARCAALLTTALANGQSMRSTVGRTVVSSNANMAPTARPGNVWATLMNGGAAGAKVDFA